MAADIEEVSSSTAARQAVPAREPARTPTILHRGMWQRHWVGWPWLVLFAVSATANALRRSELDVSNITWAVLFGGFLVYLVVEAVFFRRTPRGLAAVVLLMMAASLGLLALIVQTDRVVEWAARETGITSGRDDVRVLTFLLFLVWGGLWVVIRTMMNAIDHPLE